MKRLLPILMVLMVLLPASGLARYVVSTPIDVQGERVSLADLVPDAPQAWNDVALGPTPRPGGERVLDRKWVLQRARQVGVDGELEIVEDVVLRREGREITRREVVQAVQDALGARLHDDEKVRIDSVGLPRPVDAGAVELRARLPEGEVPSPTTVWVDVIHQGSKVDRAWARVEIHRGRPVVVLTRTLSRGTVIGARDVEVASTDSHRNGFTEPNQVIGKQVVRSLREGTVLTARDLDTVPIVERGDRVRLVARVSGVLASTVGTSLEAGGVGDLIRVENSQSGRKLTGTLREGGVVEIRTAYGR